MLTARCVGLASSTVRGVSMYCSNDNNREFREMRFTKFDEFDKSEC